ncbi:F-box/FBD/LRR-repeat protein At5g56420-like [Trifolium pratense]|uniref:F-box/FBD/LRR-repeat protein At5g56420-like n=1 Tax=Trifolium pratense TaxID=57577 RepID=UPI001E692960|nr:F-box/FBD/LRR-repeat protein At5g56420-like [Trifolium pratense]
MHRRNRINSLPDEILCHILTFLTPKEAAATTILSKRWIGLWNFVHFTNIQIDNIRSNKKFNQSVFSLLHFHVSAGDNIDSFHLEIRYGTPHLAYKRSFPHVVKWINLVVECNLKHLHIDHKIDEQDTYDVEQEAYLPKLPRSILTCRTLVSLNLRRFSVEGYSVSSIEFGFPSLKTLYFDDIHFGNGRHFVLLLSGCPILEDLQLVNSCRGISFRVDPESIQMFQNISLHKLTRADIRESYWSHFPLKALSTAKSLYLDTLKLYWEDRVNVEDHEVQRIYFEIPIFHNLTQLKLHNSWGLVIKMLYHCPKLQSLELSKEIGWQYRNDVQEIPVEEQELVPQCLSSCLRTCTIRNMGGVQSDFMLATFILKNAAILQTMEIWSEWNQEKTELEGKLSPYPKASATCQLLVY